MKKMMDPHMRVQGCVLEELHCNGHNTYLPHKTTQHLIDWIETGSPSSVTLGII